MVVAFNNRMSYISGTPDIDVTVRGPGGPVTDHFRARNGTQVVFQTPTTGDYQIVLGNEYSQVNAKLVTVRISEQKERTHQLRRGGFG